MDNRYRTAARSLLRAGFFGGRGGLMMNFGKAVIRDAEYRRAGHFAQSAGNAAVPVDLDVH